MALDADSGVVSDGERSRQAQKAEDLLRMANGDWRSTRIVHVCHHGCCSSNQDMGKGELRECRLDIFDFSMPDKRLLPIILDRNT